MSHSVVAVIISQHERLADVLAPFDENIQVEPYVAFTPEEKAEELKVSIERVKENIANEEAKPEEKQNKDWLSKSKPYLVELEGMTAEQYYEQQKDGYDLNEKGEPLRTYNPKSRWDWYSVGGRWAGYFKVKEGVKIGEWPDEGLLVPRKLQMVTEPPDPEAVDLHEGPDSEEENHTAWRGKQSWGARDEGEKYPARHADAALKCDIDWDGMIEEYRKERAKLWDLAATVLDPIRHLPYIPWPKFIERVESKELHIDQAREEYHAQEIIQLWKKVEDRNEVEKGSEAARIRDLRLWYDIDDFLSPREEYIDRSSKSCVTPFAVLKDGEWIEKGQMGWWGMVRDEKEANEWQDQFQRILDATRDDQIIVMVDVHI